jgi:colicin import membrane protein
MSAQAQHLEFAPPAPAGTGRALTAALFVHGLLLVALTASIQWKTDQTSVEAELWSAVPMAAAPKLVEVEAPPPPPPEPAPPKPAEKAEPPAPSRDADIALAKKQKQLDEEKKLKEFKEEERRKEEVKKEAEKKAKLKLEEDKRKLEAKREEERKDKERKEKELKEKERAEKERKEKEAKKLADQNKVSPDEAKKLEAIRRENMKRIAGMAGATGDANATGTAQKSSGPSDSYGGRVRARVKPNITFDDTGIVGNPAAEVEVRCSPDGTIVGRKLVKSSGNSAWDAAVLKAVDKTEILPRDIDGRVPSSLVIVFRPKD